ncbi:hypothetical protein [Patulibacter minatonensis]|uniref:hypothetical protein n=1 Tax=Patulibacter minatonensis TaxID=298163 RepID=UPI0012F9B2D3|nr:hypothetical protein [Patulibacter minatonensis]
MLSARGRRVRRLVSGGIAVGLVTGVAVVPAVAEDAPEPDPVSPTAAQPTAIPAVQADQRETLRIFRRARTAKDALPAEAVPVASDARFGRNPHLSRAIDTPTGKGWVVPGDDVVCVVVPDPVDGYGTSCAPTAVVERDGLTVGIVGDDTSAAITLVPDGASVSTTDDADRTTAVRPDASGVVVTDPERTDSIAVRTDNGTSETTLLDFDDLQGGQSR